METKDVVILLILTMFSTMDVFAHASIIEHTHYLIDNSAILLAISLSILSLYSIYKILIKKGHIS